MPAQSLAGAPLLPSALRAALAGVQLAKKEKDCVDLILRQGFVTMKRRQSSQGTLNILTNPP